MLYYYLLTSTGLFSSKPNKGATATSNTSLASSSNKTTVNGDDVDDKNSNDSLQVALSAARETVVERQNRFGYSSSQLSWLAQLEIVKGRVAGVALHARSKHAISKRASADSLLAWRLAGMDSNSTAPFPSSATTVPSLATATTTLMSAGTATGRSKRGTKDASNAQSSHVSTSAVTTSSISITQDAVEVASGTSATQPLIPSPDATTTVAVGVSPSLHSLSSALASSVASGNSNGDVCAAASVFRLNALASHRRNEDVLLASLEHASHTTTASGNAAQGELGISATLLQSCGAGLSDAQLKKLMYVYV
jgi:hypothetical protein